MSLGDGALLGDVEGLGTVDVDGVGLGLLVGVLLAVGRAVVADADGLGSLVLLEQPTANAATDATTTPVMILFKVCLSRCARAWAPAVRQEGVEPSQRRVSVCQVAVTRSRE